MAVIQIPRYTSSPVQLKNAQTVTKERMDNRITVRQSGSGKKDRFIFFMQFLIGSRHVSGHVFGFPPRFQLRLLRFDTLLMVSFSFRG